MFASMATLGTQGSTDALAFGRSHQPYRRLPGTPSRSIRLMLLVELAFASRKIGFTVCAPARGCFCCAQAGAALREVTPRTSLEPRSTASVERVEELGENRT